MPLKLFQEIKYVLIVKGFFHGCAHARRLIYRKHKASDIKKRFNFGLKMTERMNIQFWAAIIFHVIDLRLGESWQNYFF